MSDVDRIKDAVSLTDVVSRYVELKKAGINYTGLCPFHNEKTPSFYVSPERGTFKCFGCGEGGDVFTFLEKVEGLEFREVLDQLSQETGIPLEQTNTGQQEQKGTKDNLLAILDWARFFWQKQLTQNDAALRYLKKRGFTKSMIVNFQIGYAPDAWDELKNFLVGKGISEEDIERVGLIKQGERGGYYDRFRDRIIFPLRNSNGKTIAFSGRYIGNDDVSAKYLNSPETVVFNKSKELYGLDTAKQSIRKNNFVIVVEGQVDLVMGQSVFANTVATSGTSLTREHLQSLRRFTDRIVFVFDSDEAGIKAAFKASLLALTLDFEVKIAHLSEGKDPADIIMDNPEEYRDVIKNSQDVFEYWVSYILHEKISPRERSKHIDETIFPLLAHHTNPLEQDRYLQYVSSKLYVSADALRARLQQKKPTPITHDNSYQEAELQFETQGITRRTPLESLALIIYWQSNVSEENRLIDISQEIYNAVDDETKSFLDSLVASVETEEKIDSELFEIEKLYQNSIMLQNDISELIQNLSTYRSQEYQRELMYKYQQAKVQGNTQEAHKLLEAIQQNIRHAS